jgi:hypothetical protein
MANIDNPYKLQIEYIEQKEEAPFNSAIHKSKNDFTIVPEELGIHTGYYRLCIIREKEKNWQEVIRLAEQAKSEGWVGDWDKRIERAHKKLEK